MHKLIMIPLLAVVLLLAAPAPARAEGNCGWLCQIFGFDAKTIERTQIKEDAATDREREETEQTRIKEDAATVRAAEAIRLQNEHAATLQEINRQADVAIAQAQADETRSRADVDKYKAMVDSWRQTQLRLAELDTDKALEALRSQTDLGLEAINEAGETKRWALTTDMIWSVVLIIGLVILGWYFLKKQGAERTIYVLPGDRPQLPPGYRAQLSRHNTVEQEIDYADYR